MRVHELMTRDVKCCHPDENLASVAKLMWDFDCGCVPVIDRDRQVVGMVTDRDACMAAFTNGKPLHELSAGEAMSRKVVRCGLQDTVEDAQSLMRRARVRRLPVTDGAGRLVGLLSLHDIARAAMREGRWFARVRVSDVGRTFAQVSRPWAKPAPPRQRMNEAMAE